MEQEELVEMEIDKADNASSSSNDDSDEYMDVEEESPRGRKSVTSIIAEMALKTEQEAVNSYSKISNTAEDKLKRQELSRLTPAARVAYARDLETALYELSQREARELSRSKHLRIFGTSRRRYSK
ncbi:wuc [Drosophila busckii]|uniref:Wuc n=1 Tax=Drosophila busckii TaxID=30019 RepID=A0A0M4E5E7_DROBS|nr:uncharacterized protein LOC108595944 [Drosophila busckii]ALC41491.1 wuc [Drosophila busckii]